MLLQVYNKAHVRIGVVECIGLTIESDLSKFDKTLSFSININNADLLELEGYLRTKYDEFVIKEKNYSDGYYNIVAVLNLEELEGKAFEDFDSTEQTIEKCVNTALAGTGWIVNECTVTKKRTVRATFISALDIIKQALKTYLCELQFDTINKKINIYEKIGNDKGEYLMDTVNAKKIDTQEDTYDYFTKLIAVGATKDDGTPLTCTVTNNSYSDKEKTCCWKDERYTVLENLQADAQIKLDSMAQPHIAYSVELAKLGDVSIGDTITLISKDTKTRLKTRIVKLTEYPDEPYNNTCEVNSSIYSFEDIQQQQQDVNSTVDNITSDNGTISERALSDSVIDKIFARSVIAQKITAIEADIGTLNATKANITELNAVTARVGSLEANSATINDLQAATARIGVLETGYGQIQVLQTDIASINTLLAGNVSAGSTQTIVLNANNTTIANALIKSAMIESINADKINAGSINTDNVTIKSSSGGIQIADNTMQFKDKNNKVRIQIGQDTQDNFNFIVRAEDGTTTLIDGTGVKEKAIADGLIKTNMVSDKAIKGTKIDWDDFFTTINADGTHTLNSSKVKLNSNNQTLDIAFNQMTTKIENKGEGRNLCRKGWHINQDTNGRATLEITKDDWFDYVLKFNKLNSSDGWGILTNNKKIAFEYGKKYTLSFKAHTTDLTNIQVRICSESSTDIVLYPTVITLKNDNWYYDYNLTFEAKATTSQYLQFMSDNGTVYLTNIKLEKGDEATTFCDAPEDLSDWIKTNSTSVSVQQGKISSLITDTEQLTTKSNNNATAINTLNTNYSKISQTVNEINSTVSSHTTTIQGLQTSVNNANSSINQLKDSIKLKVNTSTYNTDKQGILTNISNNSTAISQLNNSISLKVEQTDITNAINNINIGGRNLLKKTKNFDKYSWGNENIWSTETEKYKDLTVKSFSGDWRGLYQSYSVVKGEIYTFSAYVKSSNESKVYFFSAPSGQSYTNRDTKTFNISTEWIRISVSFTITKTATAQFRFENSDTASKLYICGLKLEKGNKATDYTEAPEDITTYTDTKVSSVEQQITANAITTKISTAINNGTSSINTTYFTQDNTGLTIKNGGIKVLNSLNTQIFGVDTDGQLSIRGKLEQYNSNGRKSVEIKNNALRIYNYKSTNDDLVGGFANVNDFTNTSSSSGVALYGTQNHALHIGMSRSDSITRYISCVDMGDGDHEKRIDVGMEMYIRNGWGITLCNNDFNIRGFIKADAGGETGLSLIGNNAVHIGYGSSASNYAPGIDISSKGIVIWGDVTVAGTINGKTI